VFGVELMEAAILDKAPEVRRAAGKIDVLRVRLSHRAAFWTSSNVVAIGA